MIYLSGAITAETIQLIEINVQKARKVAMQMALRGIPWFCPHMESYQFDSEDSLKSITWQQWMDIDLEILARCTGILMIEGWEASKGAVMERNFALTHGIKIYYSIGEIVIDEIPKKSPIQIAQEKVARMTILLDDLGDTFNYYLEHDQINIAKIASVKRQIG